MTLYLIYLFITLIVFELILQILVRYGRTKFPWLITDKDEYPILESSIIDIFFLNSYDPILGWSPKPGGKGVDKTATGEAHFKISNDGSRNAP